MNLFTEKGLLLLQLARREIHPVDAGKLLERANRAFDIAEAAGTVEEIVPQPYGTRAKSTFPDGIALEAYKSYIPGESSNQCWTAENPSWYSWKWGEALAAADFSYTSKGQS